MKQDNKISSSHETEQVWLWDLRRWMKLPDQYSRFLQAEIWTGDAQNVFTDFGDKVLIRGHDGFSKGERREVMDELKMISNTIPRNQRIKLRVRAIHDIATGKKYGQLTVKEKLESKKGYKRCKEYDITITYELAQKLVMKVSPEWWVLKDRYHVPWPDGRLWDVNLIRWRKNFIQELWVPLVLCEVEVDSPDAIFTIPPWTIYQINKLLGYNVAQEFKCFGTAELQKTPWVDIPKNIRSRYIEIMERRYPWEDYGSLLILPSSFSSQILLPLE